MQLKTISTLLLVRGGGLILTFLLSVFVGRFFGATGMGLFTIFVAYMMLLTSISDIGLPANALRTVSVLHGEGRSRPAWMFVSKSIKILLAVSAVVALSLVVLIPILGEWMIGDADKVYVLYYSLAAAVIFVIVRMLSESMKGVGKVNLSFILDTALLPFILLLVMGLYHFSGVAMTVDDFFVIYLAFLLFIAVVMGFAMYRYSARNHPDDGEPTPTVLSRSLLPFWAGGVMSIFFLNMPVLMLPQFATTAEIGIFGVSYRLILLGTTILVTLASLFGPKFAQDYANKNLDGLKHGLRMSQLYSMFIYLPMLVAFTVFVDDILGLFGEEFVEGKNLLIIMLAGQFFNAITGLVGVMMYMIHQEKQEFYIQLFVTLLMFVLTWVLGTQYGVMGVTVAYAVSVAIKNILSWIFVKYHLNQLSKTLRGNV